MATHKQLDNVKPDKLQPSIAYVDCDEARLYFEIYRQEVLG
jgi:hypothetical protein